MSYIFRYAHECVNCNKKFAPDKFLYTCPECNGFYGASSMERLPTEQPLTETTRQFKKITR